MDHGTGDVKRARCDGVAVAASPLRRREAAAVTVGDLARRRGAVVCTAAATLADAADLLVLHNRSAAAVVGDDGALLGMVTENDILHACSLGLSPTCGVDAWLHKHIARVPSELLGSLTLRPSCTLPDAAALLRAQAASDWAFRHLVVLDGRGDLHGVLSSLDLALALCSAGADGTAAEVLKPRCIVPVCSSSAALSHVLEQMSLSRQNCALIADGEPTVSNLLGLVTPRDALRAFAEHVPITVQVGQWLRGLQASWEPRTVECWEPISSCAARMARDSVHHLVVVSADGLDIVGVLSSTDLAQVIGPAIGPTGGAAE